jgi:solute carrier family 25 (mitochondrial carnitine/acylcarnitine transporter), member 20/29
VVPWHGLLIAATIAGFVGWTVTFPFDLVKTRMQSSGLLEDNSITSYRTTWSTIVSSYRQDGIEVFALGLAPTLWRSVVSLA